MRRNRLRALLQDSRVGAVALGVLAVVCVVAVIAALTRSGADPESGRPPAAPVSAEVQRYVALGDAYTAAPPAGRAGPGAGCMRSPINYPHLVAGALPDTELEDRSCAGATTRHLTDQQSAGVAPQLDALTAETDLVTLGIGALDFDLLPTLLTRCLEVRRLDPEGAPCRKELDDGDDRLLADLPKIRERVVAVVKAIRKRSPEAQVVLVGYPRIAPATGNCPAELPVADGDVRYLHRVGRELAKALEKAASTTDVSYVDVFAASKGHDVCSDDPWVNAGSVDSSGTPPFHPLASEHRAVADLVVDAAS